MPRIPTLQEKHPELFVTSTDVDPRKRKRVVPMEVLSLGMPRTGTACMLSFTATRHCNLTIPLLAMQLALNILGYPCYHGLTLIANVRDTEMWNEALDAKFFGKGSLFTQSDWDQLLGNYSAVADLPAVAFSEDLLHCYPDAKVVLVERDIERWYQSFNDGVIMNVWSPVVRLIARLDTRFVGKLGGFSALDRWLVRGSFTEGNAIQSESEIPRTLRTSGESDAFRSIAQVQSWRWLGAAMQIPQQADP